jgi:hypothetical protein
VDGRVATVGLRLADELEPETPPASVLERVQRKIRNVLPLRR